MCKEFRHEKTERLFFETYDHTPLALELHMRWPHHHAMLAYIHNAISIIDRLAK